MLRGLGWLSYSVKLLLVGVYCGSIVLCVAGTVGNVTEGT